MEGCSAVDSTVEPVESELARKISPVPIVESQSSACSVLDKLKVPTKSDLARKRKIEKPKMLIAQTKKRKSCVTNQTDLKSVSPIQCIKDFPDECLAERKGMLFCTACRDELALKKINQVTSTRKPRRGCPKKKLESETLFKASRHMIRK